MTFSGANRDLSCGESKGHLEEAGEEYSSDFFPATIKNMS